MSQFHQNYIVERSRLTVDEVIANHFSRPNRAILVTDRYVTSRKFARPELQLSERNLSDFEIRDLFNNGTSGYGKTNESSLLTYGDYGNPEGFGQGSGHRNNLCLYCTSSTTGNPNCEWVSFGGPYGYTSIEGVTRSPTQGRINVKKLILSATQYDTIWLLELNKRSNTWRTIGRYPAPILRQASIVGRWPEFTSFESGF